MDAAQQALQARHYDRHSVFQPESMATYELQKAINLQNTGNVLAQVRVGPASIRSRNFEYTILDQIVQSCAQSLQVAAS